MHDALFAFALAYLHMYVHLLWMPLLAGGSHAGWGAAPTDKEGKWDKERGAGCVAYGTAETSRADGIMKSGTIAPSVGARRRPDSDGRVGRSRPGFGVCSSIQVG